MLIAILAVQPICVLAASYRSIQDPVGEKVYSAGAIGRMVPLAIVAGGLSLAFLLDRIRHKSKKAAAGNAGSHHC